MPCLNPIPEDKKNSNSAINELNRGWMNMALPWEGQTNRISLGYLITCKMLTGPKRAMTNLIPSEGLYKKEEGSDILVY